MKTSFKGLLSLLSLLALPAVVQAQFTFTTNTGAITITGYTGSDVGVLIPSETNGLPVRAIGTGAFQSKSAVTSVTIPDSVWSIGTNAFSNCTGLTNVALGNNVTNIAAYAFYLCGKLTNVRIPDSVTSIGLLAFGSCAGLTNITIGNSVTNIGSSAFGSRSEEHTSELQSRQYLVCRLLL